MFWQGMHRSGVAHSKPPQFAILTRIMPRSSRESLESRPLNGLVLRLDFDVNEIAFREKKFKISAYRLRLCHPVGLQLLKMRNVSRFDALPLKFGVITSR